MKKSPETIRKHKERFLHKHPKQKINFQSNVEKDEQKRKTD